MVGLLYNLLDGLSNIVNMMESKLLPIPKKRYLYLINKHYLKSKSN